MMNNRTNGWTAAILAVALCALVLVFATPGATAQQGGPGSNLLARVVALEVAVTALQAENVQLRADLAAGDAATLASANAYTDGQVAGLTSRIFAVEHKTQFMSVLGDTTLFSGTNVQVVNGMGRSFRINGLGNLIVGYNEVTGTFGDERGGSHNIVVGEFHDYLSHGGLVAGVLNRIAGPRASVIGGQENTASGPLSSVTGGTNNTASGFYASVTGGSRNTASHNHSAVSGGLSNSTTANYQWIGGTFRSPP